jgi:hypothetical protein
MIFEDMLRHPALGVLTLDDAAPTTVQNLTRLYETLNRVQQLAAAPMALLRTWEPKKVAGWPSNATFRTGRSAEFYVLGWNPVRLGEELDKSDIDFDELSFPHFYLRLTVAAAEAPGRRLIEWS